ncbi:MAG: hypothetical protein ACOX1P_17365 [Thermoguttaceae bacterium]|jgi:hypothetical protein
MPRKKASQKVAPAPITLPPIPREAWQEASLRLKSETLKRLEALLEEAKSTAEQIDRGEVTAKAIKELHTQRAWVESYQRRGIESDPMPEYLTLNELAKVVRAAIVKAAYVLKIDPQPLLLAPIYGNPTPWETAIAASELAAKFPDNTEWSAPMTRGEIARKLRMSIKTLDRWRADGKIRLRKIGHRFQIDMRDLPESSRR